MQCLELAIPPLPQLMLIGHGFWKPGQQHFVRSFNVFDMIFVLKGALFMWEEDTAYDIREGSLLVLEPNRTHGGHRPCEETTEIFWLHFIHPEPVRALDSSQISWSVPVTRRTDSDLAPSPQAMYLPKFAELRMADIVPLLKRMLDLEQTLSPASSLPLQAQFAGLLAELQGAASSQYTPRSRVLCDQAIAYLQQHLSRPFDARHMEETLHFNFDYLARCLKQHTGMSPLQYLHDLQIKKAKSLLESTGFSIAEIGEQVGIENVNYFIRIFRTRTGMAPGQYRSRRLGRA